MAIDHAYSIPPTFSGMKVGLFGGSFNPPHDGHVHVSKMILRKLRLDQLWWMVSPGNPLKNHDNLLPLKDRLRQCRKIAIHPEIRITAYEANYNTQHTVDALEILTQRRKSVNFIWIMGADNFAIFHHWDRWRKIASLMPFAVVDRPDSIHSPYASLASHYLARFRMDEGDATLLASAKPPAWMFIHGPRSFLSSSQIRNKK